MPAKVWPSAAKLRGRLYELLHHGTVGDRTSRTVGQFIVLLVIVNLIAVTLESMPDLAERYGPLFTAVEIVSLTLFTLEYALRV
jgi:voltage-gated potassium channel